MRLLPSKEQWKSWSLPSKLTAIGTLAGVISLGLYGVEKSFHFKDLIVERVRQEPALIVPHILVRISNAGDSDIAVYSRGEFVLWLPQGVHSGVQTIPGTYELFPLSEGLLENGLVNIKAGGEVPVHVKVMNQEYFARILERGDATLSLILRRSDGSIFFSGDMPFSGQYITKYYLPAEGSRK